MMDRHALYRAGLCIKCGVVKHSAGRPRCNPCHHTYMLSSSTAGREVTEAEVLIKSADACGVCRTDECNTLVSNPGLCGECVKKYPCRSAGCETPTRPGWLRCDSCLGKIKKGKPTS